MDMHSSASSLPPFVTALSVDCECSIPCGYVMSLVVKDLPLQGRPAVSNDTGD